jgi:hypothetical protein
MRSAPRHSALSRFYPLFWYEWDRRSGVCAAISGEAALRHSSLRTSGQAGRAAIQKSNGERARHAVPLRANGKRRSGWPLGVHQVLAQRSGKGLF